MRSKSLTLLSAAIAIGCISTPVVAQEGRFAVTKKVATGNPLVRACTTEARQCPDGLFVAVTRTGQNCSFAACPAGATVGPFPATPTDVPSAALVVGSNTMSARVGDTVGIGWGGKFAMEGAGSHYSAYNCADSSQNAFIRPWVINSTGGTFYFTVGPELAGCTLVLRYYVHGSDRRSADSTVTLVVAPRP